MQFKHLLPSELEQEPTGCSRQVLTCRVTELNPHPAYVRHHLAVPAHKLSALAERGDLAFREPLTITKGGTIIDGYGRWELARHQGRSTLPCLEYDLSLTEALQWILRTHQHSAGLNAFNRIMLALDLESSFQERARSNQRAGGKYKGSSNLTEAEKLDVRSEISAAAGASVGNVSEVKNLIMSAHSELLEALRSGEISIHRAYLWSQATPEEQKEQLWQHRTDNGIKRTIRHLVSRHRSKSAPPQPNIDHVATQSFARWCPRASHRNARRGEHQNGTSTWFSSRNRARPPSSMTHRTVLASSWAYAHRVHFIYPQDT